MRHDASIRAELVAYLRAMEPDALVVQEWRIGDWPAGSIADVATISASEIVGYEIKSERDTCARLTRQAIAYDRVCDRCVLVAAPRHVAKARGILGPWWGLVAWDGALHVERDASPVHAAAQRAEALLEVLWCPELRHLAAAAGLPRDGSKRVLVQRLAAGLDAARIRAAAREILRSRTDWRDATGYYAGAGSKAGRLTLPARPRAVVPRPADPRQMHLDITRRD